MAWDNKYADLALGNGQSGAGTIGDPWSIQRAATTAVEEDYVWVKAATGAETVLSGGFGQDLLAVAGTGVVANNTHLVFKCYHTTPGDAENDNFVSDMDVGGAYYQSPLDALINGIDLNKCGALSGNGQDNQFITFNGQDNIHFYHFSMRDTITANILIFAGDPFGITFNNCRFNDAQRVLDGTGDAISFIDCYGDDGIVAGPSIKIFGDGILYLGNVIKPAVQALYIIGSGSAIGNLLVGGSRGLLVVGEVLIANNTCYGQSITCIRIMSADTITPIYNNILMPAVAASDYGILIEGSGGTIRNDYNCFWGIDGVALTTPIENVKAGGHTPAIGTHSIEADPLFVDAANNDFRPRNPDVVRGGMPDISGNPGQMGAVLQKYNFANRGRMTDMARLGIIR